MEEKDRLELRPRRAEKTESSLLRTRVSALVRQHDAPVVRLDPQRHDVAVPSPFDTVGTDIRLRERPAPGLGVATKDTGLAPRVEIVCRLLLAVGESQVNDVVGTATEVDLALGRGNHVVRRRHEALERTRLCLVVAQRPERPDLRHPGGT